MEKIQCSACGGTDLVLDGEFFVCQHCGAKYTVATVQTMVDKLAEVISNTSAETVEHMITRGYQCLEEYRQGQGKPIYTTEPTGNGQVTKVYQGDAKLNQAEDYFNRALDLDPNNAQAHEGIRRIRSVEAGIAEELKDKQRRTTIYAIAGFLVVALLIICSAFYMFNSMSHF